MSRFPLYAFAALAATLLPANTLEATKLPEQNSTDDGSKQCADSWALWNTIRHGDMKALTTYVEAQNPINVLYVNCEKHSGFTLLGAAVIGGQVKMVQYLLEKGAVVDGEDEFGRTPLILALPSVRQQKEGQPLQKEIIDMLLANSANIHHADWFTVTPLIAACLSGDTVITKQLIAKGALEDLTVDDFDLLLRSAATGNQVELAKTLIEKGAGVDKQGSLNAYLSQETPLLCACAHGNYEVAALLIEKGAQVNQGDSRQYTPLILASGSRSVELVKLLLDKGADVHARTPIRQQTPLFYAVSANRTEIASLLLQHGAKSDVNVVSTTNEPNYEQTTVLILAATHNNLDLVKLLVENGADVNVKESWTRNTVLSIAKANNNQALVTYLISKGAK